MSLFNESRPAFPALEKIGLLLIMQVPRTSVSFLMAHTKAIAQHTTKCRLGSRGFGTAAFRAPVRVGRAAGGCDRPPRQVLRYFLRALRVRVTV